MSCLRRAALYCLIAVPVGEACAQVSAVSIRPPDWRPVVWDSLTLPERRAVLAPPVYWYGAELERIALNRDSPLPGEAVLTDWHTAGGTGAGISTYFLIFPNAEQAPAVGWSAVSDLYATEPGGGRIVRVRTCLYVVGSDRLAYIRKVQTGATAWLGDDSLPLPGVYRIGNRSNLTELQVWRVDSIPLRLQTRCERDLPPGE